MMLTNLTVTKDSALLFYILLQFRSMVLQIFIAASVIFHVTVGNYIYLDEPSIESQEDEEEYEDTNDLRRNIINCNSDHKIVICI